MKKEIEFTEFVEGFFAIGRGTYFSLQAKLAIYSWYKDDEAENNIVHEYDPAYYCERWAEYDDYLYAAEDNDWLVDPTFRLDETKPKEDEAHRYIIEHVGEVFMLKNSILIKKY